MTHLHLQGEANNLSHTLGLVNWLGRAVPSEPLNACCMDNACIVAIALSGRGQSLQQSENALNAPFRQVAA